MTSLNVQVRVHVQMRSGQTHVVLQAPNEALHGEVAWLLSFLADANKKMTGLKARAAVLQPARISCIACDIMSSM